MSDPNKPRRTEVHNHGTVVGQVIGDYNTVIQHFVEGIASLPTDYSVRIQNFISEYLGTPERPEPFGGREAQFRELDAWLENGDVAPYLFLSSPAGRGKSALLTQWSRKLLEREESGDDGVAVVFIPISIRFRTNLASVFFGALVARLARLHGDEVPAANTSDEVWRGMLADYFNQPLPDGRRLLIIIDGIDESADWEPSADIFPLNPPDDLKVIISARNRPGDLDGTGWLDVLGWSRAGLGRVMELPPLSVDDVGDVFQKMHRPLDEIGVNPELVAELHRLSQGDPLLVNLYVASLSARGDEALRLRPEDLRAIQPGLEGYFDRWWDEQRRLWGKADPLRESSVRAVLNLLACALGPLSKDDILSLTPESINLDTWVLDSVMTSLTRIIIGDGQIQGYVFSHPRLGNYFYDKLATRDRDRWEGYYISWGRETIAALTNGLLPPGHVSAYLVQYFGIHLERRAVPEDLLSLVNGSWKAAWEAFEGSYSGFMNDVTRTFRTLTALDQSGIDNMGLAKYIGGEALCCLCVASISTVAYSVPPILITRLVKEGLWSPAQGLVYARQTPAPERKSEAISGLVPDMPDSLLQTALAASLDIYDDAARVKALLALTPRLSKVQLTSLLEDARRVVDKVQRAVAIVGLASHLDEDLKRRYAPYVLDRLSDVLEEVLSTEDEMRRSFDLAALGGVLPQPLLGEACAAARSFDHPGYRTIALKGISSTLAKAGRHGEAIDVARMMEDRQRRAQSLTDVLLFLQGDYRERILNEALENVLSVLTDEPPPASGRAPESADDSAGTRGEFYRHMDVLDRQRVKRDAVETALSLCPYLDESGKQGLSTYCFEALGAVELEHRWRLIIELARHLDQGAKQQLADIASSIAEGYVRGVGEADEGDDKEKYDLLKSLRGRGAQLQILALAGLAPLLPEPKRSEAVRLALESVESIDNMYESYVEADKAKSLILIASAVEEPDKTRLFTEVLRKAERLAPRSQREVLDAAAPQLPPQLLPHALDVLRNVSDQDERNWALEQLIPHLPTGLLSEAQDIARGIGDADDRLDALVTLAPYLPDDLRHDLLRLARTIPDKSKSVEVQIKLIPYLPDTLVGEILRSVAALSGRESKGIMLVLLAPSITPDLLGEALSVARSLQGDLGQVDALALLAKGVSGPDKTEILREAMNVYLKYEPFYGLGELLPQLSNEALREFKSNIEGMKDARMREDAAEALLLELAARGAYEEALDAARNMGNKYAKAELLTKLTLRLPATLAAAVRDSILQEAVAACWDADDDKGIGQHNNLGKLASLMSNEARQKLLDQAERVENEQRRAWIVKEIAPHLSQGMALDYVERAEGIKYEPGRNEVFAAIAVRLAELRQPDLFYEVSARVTNEFILSEALVARATHLPDEMLDIALDSILSTRSSLWEYKKREMLTQLTPRMVKLPKNYLYELWVSALSYSTTTRGDLLIVLSGIVGVLRELGGSEAVIETYHAINKAGQWWP
ncbi:MAG TPA: hypothetical protein VF297_20295 [Pyrinomonadaceae bacterium]